LRLEFSGFCADGYEGVPGIRELPDGLDFPLKGGMVLEEVGEAIELSDGILEGVRYEVINHIGEDVDGGVPTRCGREGFVSGG